MKSLLAGNPLLLLFVIMALGYALGRIRVKGIGLGAAGILIVALIFGHFDFELPSVVQNIGLAAFVTAVGFIAGPGFFENFRGKARAYVAMGVVIILSAAAACLLFILLVGVPVDLSLGLLAGALTTTPGLAAGIEVTGSDLVSVGYGIAYPFGVIAVVLFVQLIPRVLKANMEEEKKRLQAGEKRKGRIIGENLICFDSYGLFSFSIAIVLGVLIGLIDIPLPGGGNFSLGTSGGPLLMGLVIGNRQVAGVFDLRIKNATLTTMRELGLALFLAGAGTRAGAGFVATLAAHGPVLFVYGAVMTIVPLGVGFLAAKYIFHLPLLDLLGSICGGMTSTPALGTLISSTGTDDVTASYAATYPIALALVVIVVELIGGLL